MTDEVDYLEDEDYWGAEDDYWDGSLDCGCCSCCGCSCYEDDYDDEYGPFEEDADEG